MRDDFRSRLIHSLVYVASLKNEIDMMKAAPLLVPPFLFSVAEPTNQCEQYYKHYTDDERHFDITTHLYHLRTGKLTCPRALAIQTTSMIRHISPTMIFANFITIGSIATPNQSRTTHRIT